MMNNSPKIIPSRPAPVNASTATREAENSPIASPTSPVTASDAASTIRIRIHATVTDTTINAIADGTSTSAVRMTAPGSPAASERTTAAKNKARSRVVDIPKTIWRIGVSAGKKPPSRSTLVVESIASMIELVIAATASAISPKMKPTARSSTASPAASAAPPMSPPTPSMMSSIGFRSIARIIVPTPRRPSQRWK